MNKLRELVLAAIERLNAWWDFAVIGIAIIILLIVSALEACGKMKSEDEEDGGPVI